MSVLTYTANDVTSLMQLTQRAQSLTASITHLDYTRQDYKTLRTFTTMMAQGKVNRPLMEFVERSGKLSQYISDMPAVESLDMLPCRAGDRKTVQALENLQVALSRQSSDMMNWTQQAAQTVDGLIQSTGEELDHLKASLEALTTQFTNGQIDETSLSITSMETISFDARLKAIENLVTILENLAPINASYLHSAETRQEVKVAFEQIVTMLSPYTGMTVSEDRLVSMSAPLEQSYQPAEQVLGELGYSVASMSTLLDKSTQLVTVLESIVELRSEFAAELSALSEQTPNAPDLTLTEEINDGDDVEESEPAQESSLDEHQILLTQYLQILSTSITQGVQQTLGVIATAQTMSALIEETV